MQTKPRTSNQILIDQINRSPKPIPVYYEQYRFKRKPDDESSLIGYFGPGTTIEQLRDEAGVGNSIEKRKLGKLAVRLRRFAKSASSKAAQMIIEEAAKKIDALA